MPSFGSKTERNRNEWTWPNKITSWKIIHIVLTGDTCTFNIIVQEKRSYLKRKKLHLVYCLPTPLSSPQYNSIFCSILFFISANKRITCITNFPIECWIGPFISFRWPRCDVISFIGFHSGRVNDFTGTKHSRRFFVNRWVRFSLSGKLNRFILLISRQ